MRQIQQINSLQTTFKEKLDKFINSTVINNKQFNLQIDKNKIWRQTEFDNFNECYVYLLENVLLDQVKLKLNQNNTSYEKIQQYTNIIKDDMNKISTKCGKALNNEYIVKCSCGKSPVACFCMDCFDEQIHQGPEHVYYVFKSNGICDCGQASAFNPKFFCKKHSHKNIDYQQQIQQENQQLFDIRKLISVLVFLTRLQLSFIYLLLQDNEYQKDYNFITQILLEFLQIKHPIVQYLYSRVIISKYNNLTIDQIEQQFDLDNLYSNVFDINEYMEKIKNGEQQLIDQPIYTLLIVDYLIKDKNMIQYLIDQQVIETQYRIFIRNQFFIYNQLLLQQCIEKDLYINEHNQNIFTDKTTKLFFTKRISNKKLSLIGTIFDISNQIQDNITGDKYINQIGLASELIDQFIIQACFCRLYGNYVGVEKVKNYRLLASIYEGLSQITTTEQTEKQIQISNDVMEFLKNKLDCFINVFEQQPRNTYGVYSSQQEMAYFTILAKKVQGLSIQSSQFYMQMKNVYNCCNFLTSKLSQLLYLAYVLQYNCLNVKYRTEIVENDKIYFDYLEAITVHQRALFIPFLQNLFETQCVNKDQLNVSPSISRCSTQIFNSGVSDLSYMLFYSVMFMTNDMLIYNYKKLQEYIFTPYNLLVIYTSRVLQYIELVHGQQDAISQLVYSIRTYNCQSQPYGYLLFQMLQQIVRVLFTKSCLDGKMLRKLGISVEQLFNYFYIPYAETISIQRETVQFLQYLLYLPSLQLGDFVAKYYFLYGCDQNNQILQNALEEKIIDQDQVNKVQADATINLIVCFFQKSVYKSPREILYHQIINLFINKGQIYKDQIHETFCHNQSYDFSIVQSIIDDISVEIETQQDEGIVYDGYIPSNKAKLNQKGIQMIYAYDFDFYNQNLLYFIEQSCNNDELHEFVYKHLQIQGAKQMLGCISIMQQLQQIVKVIVEEKDCQYINSNDVFIILCYIFILGRSQFEEPLADILVQRIIGQLRQNYDKLITRYPKAIKILLDCVLQNNKNGQQVQEQQDQPNIKSKLQSLKDKFKTNKNQTELETNIQQYQEQEEENVDLIQQIQQNCQFCQICQLQMDQQKLYYPAYISMDYLTQNLQIRVFGCQHACHQYCLEQSSKAQNVFRCPICKLEYNFMIPIIQDDNNEFLQKLIKLLQNKENVEITIDACIQLIEGIKQSSVNNKNQNIKLSALILNIIQNFMKQNYQQNEQYQQYLQQSSFIKYLNQDTILYNGNNIYTQLLNYNTLFNSKYIQQKILEIYPNIQQQIDNGLEQIYTLQQFIEQIIIYQVQQYSSNNQQLIKYEYSQSTIEQPQPIEYHLERFQFMKNKLQLFKQLNENNYKYHNQMICLYCNQAIEKTQEMIKTHQTNCNYLEQVFYIPEQNVILFYNIQTQKCYVQNSPYTQKDGTTNASKQYFYNLFLNQKLVDDLYKFIESQQFNCIQEDYLKQSQDIFYLFGIKP